MVMLLKLFDVAAAGAGVWVLLLHSGMKCNQAAAGDLASDALKESFVCASLSTLQTCSTAQVPKEPLLPAALEMCRHLTRTAPA
jgi:hypothetical protein